MSNFRFTDNFRGELLVDSNRETFELAYEKWKDGTDNEAIYLSITNDGIANSIGFTIEGAKDLIKYLTEVVEYFEERE